MIWIEETSNNFFGYIRGKLLFRVSWQPELNKWRRYRFGSTGKIDSVNYYEDAGKLLFPLAIPLATRLVPS